MVKVRICCAFQFLSIQSTASERECLGVYVQKNNGEPENIQSMLVRVGLSSSLSFLIKMCPAVWTVYLRRSTMLKIAM